MALDRSFDDGQSANVAVSTSTVSAYVIHDLIFILTVKDLCISDISERTRQQRRTFLISEGGGRQQRLTQAASNELNLGEGG